MFFFFSDLQEKCEYEMIMVRPFGWLSGCSKNFVTVFSETFKCQTLHNAATHSNCLYSLKHWPYFNVTAVSSNFNRTFSVLY